MYFRAFRALFGLRIIVSVRTGFGSILVHRLQLWSLHLATRRTLLMILLPLSHLFLTYYNIVRTDYANGEKIELQGPQRPKGQFAVSWSRQLGK